MKTTTLVLCLLFIISVHPFAFGQIENHAIGRSAFSDATSVTTDATILQYYFKSDADRIAFLSKYGFTSTDLPSMTTATAGKVTPSFPQAGSDAAVLADPRMGIDALGTFIANRFKKEINIAFLNKFKDDLAKIPNLDLLFPASKMVLIDGDPYNYPVFMETLRQGFVEDINNLPRALPQIMAKVDPSNGDLVVQAAVLAKIITDPNTINNYVTTLNTIATNLPASAPLELKKGIYALAFTANALYKTDKDLAFIDNQDNLNEVAWQKRYMALLIRQNELYLSTLTSSLSRNSLTQILTLVNQLIPVYGNLADQAKALKNLNAQNKITPQVVQESFGVLLKAMKNAVAAYKAFDPNFVTVKIDVVIQYGETINNLSRLIIEKKYGLALLAVIPFVDSVSNKKLTAEQKKAVSRYTSFITNVLRAESKDDIVQALETSANPVGSYRVKRNSTFNISLNAYAGGFYGTNFNDSEVFGFTAPIGIYLGWGNLGKEKSDILYTDDGKSLGLLLTFIDVGAVTAFRLQDDKTEIADVSWSNVFAPGAYASIGLGKCPVSINLGGQVGPEITSIDSSGAAIFEKGDWHWRVAVLIDIPFFDFYTKQKKLE